VRPREPNPPSASETATGRVQPPPPSALPHVRVPRTAADRHMKGTRSTRPHVIRPVHAARDPVDCGAEPEARAPGVPRSCTRGRGAHECSSTRVATASGRKQASRCRDGSSSSTERSSSFDARCGEPAVDRDAEAIWRRFASRGEGYSEKACLSTAFGGRRGAGACGGLGIASPARNAMVEHRPPALQVAAMLASRPS